MRTRLTAALTASAVAISALTVPQAGAAPLLEIRQSQHGQYLCTVEHDSASTAAAEALTDAYTATLQKASAAVQASYPQYEGVFSAVTAAVTPTTMTKLTQFSALSAQMKKDGYTDQDILAIVLGASNPSALIQANLTQTLLDSPEASINRANALANQTSTTPRAPLLSDGSTYSSKFRSALRSAEAETDLASAIAAFDAEAGNAAMAALWQDCVTELQAKGMTLGEQDVPEIEVPVNGGGTGGGSSFLGNSSVVIIAGILAVSVLTVGAAYVANGGLANGLPNLALPFPLGA